jgi:hypothetical protein
MFTFGELASLGSGVSRVSMFQRSLRGGTTKQQGFKSLPSVSLLRSVQKFQCYNVTMLQGFKSLPSVSLLRSVQGFQCFNNITFAAHLAVIHIPCLLTQSGRHNPLSPIPIPQSLICIPQSAIPNPTSYIPHPTSHSAIRNPQSLSTKHQALPLPSASLQFAQVLHFFLFEESADIA